MFGCFHDDSHSMFYHSQRVCFFHRTMASTQILQVANRMLKLCKVTCTRNIVIFVKVSFCSSKLTFLSQDI